MAVKEPSGAQEQWLSDEELQMAVRLGRDELEPLRIMFELAAGAGQEVLHGKNAVPFFSRSGLSSDVLKEIWASCDRNKKGHLTRYEFVLAARLVALAQVGIQANFAQLRAYKARFPMAKFELPENIYTDDFDMTEFEKAIKHEYDVETGKWRRTLVNVVIESAPFSQGAMRAAYHMRDLSASGDRAFVAKIAKTPGTPVSQYFDDVRMQTESEKWARAFNSKRVPKRVEFIAAWVVELIDRTERPLCGVERFVPGTYVKYANNWDWRDDRRYARQAFSHFTWEESKHTLLICDIQGVADMYTDPQIHSIDGTGYGQGNLGMRGVSKFLDAHTCNSICRFLKLPARKGKVVDTGTVVEGNLTLATLTGHGPPTRTTGRGPVGLGAGLEAREAREKLVQELNGQWQRQMGEMQAKARAKVKARLEAERGKMERDHALALQEQQQILEEQRGRLEAEKADWLECEERKLKMELDRRLEDHRIKHDRAALGTLLLPPGTPTPAPSRETNP
ncbi:kinase-like domain-containing protein, partial [Baffinella frigidus]